MKKYNLIALHTKATAILEMSVLAEKKANDHEKDVIAFYWNGEISEHYRKRIEINRAIVQRLGRYYNNVLNKIIDCR